MIELELALLLFCNVPALPLVLSYGRASAAPRAPRVRVAGGCGRRDVSDVPRLPPLYQSDAVNIFFS